VGADGDGVGAAPDGKPLFLPLTLPDETVRAVELARRGEGWTGAAELLEASVERVAPPCPHFGACGGCRLQHWADAPYASWKSGLLIAALARAGFVDAEVAPMVRTAPGTRRRMDLAIRRTRAGVLLGLHRDRSAEVVDLTSCTVLDPELATMLPALRDLLSGLAGLKREGALVANLLDTGPDLLLRLDGEISTGDRTRLAAFARAQGVPRISWTRAGGAPEIAAQLARAEIGFSGVTVVPPPGAFLQASRTAEAAIVAAVCAGLPKPLARRAHILELYAGCGTLSFALARHARVTAFEGDADLVAALRTAAGAAGVSGRVTASVRDLARQPAAGAELDVACVVLDPPYAGAAAQIASIAAARPARVIYVSCNPAALARDARTLREAGYALVSATPIDQFLWSARLESVCVFSRD
jgi:23S rRNA (uracil1939-C5)-methyltransferase